VSADNEKKLPVGFQLMASDEKFRDNMHSVLDDLRENSPVLKDDQLNRWVLTRHDQITEIVANKNNFARNWEKYSGENTFARMIGTQIKSLFKDLGMIDLDGEEHLRLRKLVAKYFTPKAISSYKPQIETIVDQIFINLKEKESFDFIAEIAAPIPTMVIANVLGVDENDHKDFKLWTEQLIKCVDPGLDEKGMQEVFSAINSIQNYFKNAIQDRVKNPKDDLITKLLLSKEDSQSLTNEEIVTTCLILIIAGNMTTTDLIGNGLVALLKNPNEFQKLKENSSLMPSAVEEMLRYDVPITEIPRISTKETLVGDTKIDKGQTLSLMLAAANHDPSVFKCPHMFNIERNEGQHLSFGGGIHYCLGAHLAKLEIEIVFKKLITNFPDLKLCSDLCERKSVPTMNGFKFIMVKVR
jgi:cytochrome P450